MRITYIKVNCILLYERKKSDTTIYTIHAMKMAHRSVAQMMAAQTNMAHLIVAKTIVAHI